MRKLSYLLPVLLLAACGVEGTSWLINTATEQELGLEVHNQVIAEYPVVEHTTVQGWIDELGARIQTVSAVERDDLDYRFHVVQSDQINAFAVPGGWIYVTTGLIEAVDNEAELAAVVGHEVGHVAHRHGVARLERALAVGLVTSLFLGDGFAAEAINFITSMVLNTTYSQDQEYDADDQGLVFAANAGYNPWGMIDLFYLFDSMSSSSWLPDWLSSHPQPLARAERQIQRIETLWPGLTRDSADKVWEMSGEFGTIQEILSTY
ncbi:MAG: M48 family metalloprotease [Bradymonadales bacterium]|nr:M48 family metalloprotease [Bradymonadales bacterium]